MKVDNNLNSMLNSELKINQSASNLAQVSSSIDDSEFSSDVLDFINAMAEQIPEVISYKANAKGIETQSAATEALLNIKA